MKKPRSVVDDNSSKHIDEIEKSLNYYTNNCIIINVRQKQLCIVEEIIQCQIMLLVLILLLNMDISNCLFVPLHEDISCINNTCNLKTQF